MKKVFLVTTALFLAACGNDKNNDDLIEYLDGKSQEAAEEDARAKEAMDMSKGARVYEITAPDFSGKRKEEK